MFFSLIENNQTLARYELSDSQYHSGAWYRETDGKWIECPVVDVLFDGRTITRERAVEFCRKYNLDPDVVLAEPERQAAAIEDRADALAEVHAV